MEMERAHDVSRAAATATLKCERLPQLLAVPKHHPPFGAVVAARGLAVATREPIDRIAKMFSVLDIGVTDAGYYSGPR